MSRRSFWHLSEDEAAPHGGATPDRAEEAIFPALLADEGRADVALDSGEEKEQEIRDSAIFELSQRSDDESAPALIEVARSADEATTRRTALFWSAQSEDPRVVRFFEEISLDRMRQPARRGAGNGRVRTYGPARSISTVVSG